VTNDRGTQATVADTPTNEETPQADAGQAALGPTPAPGPVEPRPPSEPPRPPERRPPPRGLVLAVAFLVPCVVIALGVWSMIRAVEKSETAPAPSASQTPPPAAPALAPPPAEQETAPSLAPGQPPEFIGETDDGEPSTEKRKPPKVYKTVHQAATESCSTESVEGLSKQIIEQARCIKPNAFVPLPSRKNLVVSSNVFPYLELEARNGLVRALDANPTKRMTLNSALRTVAQQYLVSRWGAGKRCGAEQPRDRRCGRHRRAEPVEGSARGTAVSLARRLGSGAFRLQGRGLAVEVGHGRARVSDALEPQQSEGPDRRRRPLQRCDGTASQESSPRGVREGASLRKIQREEAPVDHGVTPRAERSRHCGRGG
jgi:hypothetical protein